MAKKQYFVESELVFVEKSTHPRFIDVEGSNFGKLTVLGFAGITNKCTFWYCRCECGNIAKINVGSLKKGVTQSCGCFCISQTSKANTIHGHCKNAKQQTSTYRAWHHMTWRCRNPKCKDFKDYGGRGITVCERWQKFENFLEDMGERPKGLSLERDDVNGNYCPENCRWATMKEQQNNRRNNHWITFNGKTQTIAQWGEEMEIDQRAIYSRIIKMGWTIERAFTIPVQKRNKL